MAIAKTEQRSADLASQFGLTYATRLFGEEAVASLPVRQSGKHKGKPKGYIIWLKTTTPGYCAYVGGGAGAGQVVRAWIGAGPLSSQDDALEGVWLGRRQNLCSSRLLLGPQGRAAYAAEFAATRGR